MIAFKSMMERQELKSILEKLDLASKNSDHIKVRELLLEAVPEFKPQCGIEDFLFKARE